MELKEGAVIAERFRLIRQLGKGGMGEVWAAQHISLEVACAVKFIHGESADQPDVRMRFQREAKASASLRSANVVQILDYGVWENVPYLAMEYLDGEPMSTRLKRRGRLDPFETFRIIAGVGKGLAKAHAAGIVHRDLKPENIFLVHDEEGETPKVLDFGVAKSTTTLDSNTRTGALLGTPYYMSPEQAQGTKAVDHRADLWSLAVVTFRCLTGELPFKSTALGDLLIKIVTHPLPVPSHLAPGLPEGFDGWWERAAQRDPERRFQSAKELVEALGLALNVSVPSPLGQTPMPGKQQSPLQATVIADFSTGPPYGALPFNAQPALSVDTPHPTQAMPPGAIPRFGSGAHPAPHLSESGSSGSVAGVAAAPFRPTNGKTVAVVGISLAALAIAGVVGAFVAFSGPSESATAPSASEAPAPAAPSEAPPPEPTAKEEPPPPPAPVPSETPEPPPGKNTPPPRRPPPPAPAPATPAPPPAPANTTLDVPKPAPPPKPKPRDPVGF